MIDQEGFRPNVGIVLLNKQDARVLWAKRLGNRNGWQFPQGGIDEGESPEDAMFRELQEEVGLLPGSVRVLGQTKGWLKYRLPERMTRNNSSPGFLGQKQRWYLLEMLGRDDKIDLEASPNPEFQEWRWVSYWYPVSDIVDFKKQVYRAALSQLVPYTLRE